MAFRLGKVQHSLIQSRVTKMSLVQCMALTVGESVFHSFEARGGNLGPEPQWPRLILGLEEQKLRANSVPRPLSWGCHSTKVGSAPGSGVGKAGQMGGTFTYDLTC